MSIIPVLYLFIFTFLITILEFLDNKVSTIKTELELLSPMQETGGGQQVAVSKLSK